MVNIIYDRIGSSKRVPGIPYEDRLEFARSIITLGVPTTAEIQQLLAESTRDTLVAPWSLDVIKGFHDYVPTTFKQTTDEMSLEEAVQYFDSDHLSLPEEERVLLQLQSELDAKSATLDAAIIHNRKDFMPPPLLMIF